jgi:RNA polymerase sigma-70 factor, ECF subfamily
MFWSKWNWCLPTLRDVALGTLIAAGAAACSCGAHSLLGAAHPRNAIPSAVSRTARQRPLTVAGRGVIVPHPPGTAVGEDLRATVPRNPRGTVAPAMSPHTASAHGGAVRTHPALAAPAQADSAAVESLEGAGGLGALAVAAQEGDQEAFARIYSLLNPPLLAYLRKLVGDLEAEDVASETWSLIIRALPRFRGQSDGFRRWAFTIARHRALNHLTRRRPVLPLPTEELPAGPALDDTAQGALDAVSTRRALAAIRALPYDQARAVLLRTVIGLNAPEAARILGKQPASVRAATSRGLRNLAGRLSPSPAHGTAPPLPGSEDAR